MSAPTIAPAEAHSTPLPHGFVVRLDRYTEVREEGTVLVGGSPTRVTRLRPAAARSIRDRRITVTDRRSGALAEHLLEAGLAHPVVDALPDIPLTDLTVVVPVRDRAASLARLLDSVPAVAAIVVVDDASIYPDAIADVVVARRATLIARPRHDGVSAARNAGLAAVSTPFVAFIDSDVVLEERSLQTMLRHFADPRVALVAPRVLGIEIARPTAVRRYENARSSLDLGRAPANVRPRATVSWVSSTCLVGRVAPLGGGFDASMSVGEDVDLVWRLSEAGHRVRFEPRSTVRHDHRSALGPWLARKFFYGTGVMPLAERHPRAIAPVVLPPWGIALLVAAVAQRRWSTALAGAAVLVTAIRVLRRLGGDARSLALAARLVRNGVVSTAAQGSALALRHWWPAALVASVWSRRARRVVVAAVVLDTIVEFVRTRPRLGIVRFAALRRLDDLAYGAGVWWSALTGRSTTPLAPAVTGLSRREGR